MAVAFEPLYLPEPPDSRKAYYQAHPEQWREAFSEWALNVRRELEQYVQVRDQPAGDLYAVTNLTVTRSYDADSTSVAELADVVGTLIADLQKKGILQQ